MKYLILLLLCVSCGDDNFRKIENLDTFRILGVTSSAPEVAPGSSVNLQVLVSDVYGTDATVSGTFEHCMDPGISRGAQVTCKYDPAAVSGAYNITFGSLLPDGFSRTGLNAATVAVTVPTTILDGKTSKEKFNGVGYITIFRFVVNGKEHMSFKRIIATDRPSKNANPSGSALLANGAPLTTAPSDGTNLASTSSSPETYEVINSEGTQERRLEEFDVAWYSDTGKFDKPKAKLDESVEYQGEEVPKLILAIIRDERGGMDFVKVSFP